MESSFLVCDYPIIVINTVTKLDILNLSGGTYVLVADEALAHEVLLKVKDTGNYAVCITRKKYKDIDCTDGCLYVAERDSISGKTFIHPKI